MSVDGVEIEKIIEYCSLLLGDVLIVGKKLVPCYLEVPRESLVVLKTLSTQEGKPRPREQRENIFHSRCLIRGKLCGLIIDGGSCTNVASSFLEDKLGLEVTSHPKPYALHWLDDNGSMKVDSKVSVKFAIRSYSDETECDLVLMQASHLSLRRP